MFSYFQLCLELYESDRDWGLNDDELRILQLSKNDKLKKLEGLWT